jgi:hypothetical protein
MTQSQTYFSGVALLQIKMATTIMQAEGAKAKAVSVGSQVAGSSIFNLLVLSKHLVQFATSQWHDGFLFNTMLLL